MKYELPPLPYPKDALEPYIGRNTLEFHYEKHHKSYLEKFKKAVAGTPHEKKTLEEIIRSVDEPEIFNNGAQVWNHNFYWNSMLPGGGGQPPEKISVLLKKNFGSLDDFRRKITETAVKQFGSGYVWLVQIGDDKLDIIGTHDADNPLRLGKRPLLTIDVWEHAYYLDYQNRRQDHVEAFLHHLLNWRFVEKNLKAHTMTEAA